MVDYLKRIIIVKEKSTHRKVKGSVKIVKEKSKVKFIAELISADVNFNNYAWQLCGEDKSFSGDMENALRFDVPLDDDFHFFKGGSFCIYNKENKDVLCYGEYGEPCLKESEIIKIAENKTENKIEYDDEIIATENYYQKENEKLLYKQTYNFKNENNEKIEKKEIDFPPFCDEEDFGGFKNRNFAETVKDKINKLIEGHEKITSLNESVEGGSFVKINYDNYRSYIVGKIEDCGTIKYILYGVNGSFGVLPENFHPGAKFIPESEFELEGRGYYFIFQDGKTGEII